MTRSATTTFGKLLKDKREQDKLTIREISLISGFSHAKISRIENDKLNLSFVDIMTASLSWGVDIEELKILALEAKFNEKAILKKRKELLAEKKKLVKK